MDRFGNDFFPDAALTGNKHGDVGRRDLLDDIDDLFDLDRLTEDAVLAMDAARGALDRLKP